MLAVRMQYHIIAQVLKTVIKATLKKHTERVDFTATIFVF